MEEKFCRKLPEGYKLKAVLPEALGEVGITVLVSSCTAQGMWSQICGPGPWTVQAGLESRKLQLPQDLPVNGNEWFTVAEIAISLEMKQDE